MIGYDNIPENANILLDLPFHEGIGIITRDVAKPHHEDVDLKNTPIWDSNDLVTDGNFEATTNANSYTSDFSNPDVGGDEDLDGWNATDGAVDGNIDGIGGQDDNLRFTINGDNATHRTSKILYTPGKTYRTRFDYYIPAGQSNIDAILPFIGESPAELNITNVWTNFDIYHVATSSTFHIYATDSPDQIFQDLGADDVFYVRNIIIDEVTFDDWTDTADSLGPMASGGVLTNKASWAGYQAAESVLEQAAVVPIALRSYLIEYDVTRAFGAVQIELGSTNCTSRATGGSFSEYIITTDTDHLKIKGNVDFKGTVDNVRVRMSGGVDGPTLYSIGFDGVNEYLELANADCADLDFMAGDFSFAVWVNWFAGMDSQIVIGRYELDTSGWELYFYNDSNHYLTLRFHHAAGATTRTACYSRDWIKNTWHFLSFSRSGSAAPHYRNGVPLTTICSSGGLIDPETCAQDLVLGVRYTKNDNYFKGSMWRPRVWNRALTVVEWQNIFERERHFFGV